MGTGLLRGQAYQPADGNNSAEHMACRVVGKLQTGPFAFPSNEGVGRGSKSCVGPEDPGSLLISHYYQRLLIQEQLLNC